MYRAVDVAWKTLQEAKKKGIKLSNLQLQKLVYIAHGYLLGWKAKPLIREQVEAWKYGTVIPSIYHEFKDYKDEKISLENTDFSTELDADTDAISVIQGVLKLYGSYNAMTLVNWTNQAGSPWHDTWHEQGGSSYQFCSIDNELIKSHYRKVISMTETVKGL